MAKPRKNFSLTRSVKADFERYLKDARDNGIQLEDGELASAAIAAFMDLDGERQIEYISAVRRRELMGLIPAKAGEEPAAPDPERSHAAALSEARKDRQSRRGRAG